MDTADIQSGRALQERRAELGLSIEEVADKTRIRREFITALENEEYDKLPGTAYICGFLRNYADVLELDANQLVAAYLSKKNANSSPPPLVKHLNSHKAVTYILQLSS